MVSSGVRSAIELVDLEGARQAAQHALVHGEAGDVVAFEQDAAAVRLQHAGELVDDGGLAGAVRPDQRVAGALLHLQREIAGDAQAAEGLFEIAGFERDRHGASLSGTATTALRPANCRMIEVRQRTAPSDGSRAADQHDHDQHEADPEQPVLRGDGSGTVPAAS